LNTPSRLPRRRFLARTGGLAAATAAAGLLSPWGAGPRVRVGAALADDANKAATARPLAVLFYGGALPAVEKDLSAEYEIRAMTAGLKPGAGGGDQDNVAGLEQLEHTDVWVGSVNKRNFPGEQQLAHFRKFLDAGKPFVGYRAASHIFQNWLEADKAVWGAKYGGHHLSERDKDLVVEPAEGAMEHAILKGVDPLPRPSSGSYNYTELEPDVKVLLYSGLPGDMMPHTWVRENAKTGGRAFYTRYDAGQIGGEPAVRAIFIRGMLWALNRDMAAHRKAKA
jgi:type 1 glutamine amidotransferase